MRSSNDQLALIYLGRMIEKQFPHDEFDTMEEYRVFLNERLGINIQTGQHLDAVRVMVEDAIKAKQFDRASKIL